MILTDPTLVVFTLRQNDKAPDSVVLRGSILVSAIFLRAISFALLPRKVANIGLAADLPLAGSVALTNHFFNS